MPINWLTIVNAISNLVTSTPNECLLCKRNIKKNWKGSFQCCQLLNCFMYFSTKLVSFLNLIFSYVTLLSFDYIFFLQGKKSFSPIKFYFWFTKKVDISLITREASGQLCEPLCQRSLVKISFLSCNEWW